MNAFRFSRPRTAWAFVTLLTALAATTSWAVAPAQLPPPETTNLFVPLEFSPLGVKETSPTVVRYSLFEPSDRTPGRRFPLIVWLHDHGLTESDPKIPEGWLNHLGGVFPTPDRRNYPFYLLAMQAPPGSSSWTSSSDEAPFPLALLETLVEESIDRFPIDRRRVSLVGVGSGAAGGWALATRRPERWAALLLINPRDGFNAEGASALASTPIWLLAPMPVDEPLAGLTAARGIVAQTLALGPSWEEAFARYGLVDWLLAQRQGAFCWQRPGRRPWSLAALALQFGLPALVIAACAWEWRRRRMIVSSPVPVAALDQET